VSVELPPPLRPPPARRRSLRRQITYGVAVSSALLLPVVLLALAYLGRIQTMIEEPLVQDSERVRLVGELRDQIERLRTSEEAFVIFGDSSFLDENRAASAQILQIAVTGQRLGAGATADFAALRAPANRYREAMEAIARSRDRAPDLSPPALLLTVVMEYSKDARALITSIGREEDPEMRRALIRRARAELGDLYGYAVPAIADLDPRLGSLLGSLQDGHRRLETAAAELGAQTRADLDARLRDAARIGGHGRRDLVAVLLLTVVAVALVAVVVPRCAVAPLGRLLATLRRAAEGDYAGTSDAFAEDEIGEIAETLNRVLHRVRTFDGLKTRRLREAEARFRAVADRSPEGIATVTAAGLVSYVNPQLRGDLGLSSARTDLPFASLRDVPGGYPLHLDVLRASRGEAPLEERPYVLGHGAGAREFLVTAAEIRDAQGEIALMALFFRPGLGLRASDQEGDADATADQPDAGPPAPSPSNDRP
jgi:PAS domain-containing protein